MTCWRRRADEQKRRPEDVEPKASLKTSSGPGPALRPGTSGSQVAPPLSKRT